METEVGLGESLGESVFDRFFRYSVECVLGWGVRSVCLTTIWKRAV